MTTPTPSRMLIDAPAARVAAAASLAAGLVHAAAARGHATDFPVVATLFGLCAVAQAAWAVRFLRRPTRHFALAGVALQEACLATWLASRTVGIPFVAGLEQREPVGLQDGVASGLEAIALVAVVLGLAALRGPRAGAPRRRTVAAGVLAAATLAAAVPAMATPHAHVDDAGAAHATADGGHDGANHVDGGGSDTTTTGAHGDDGHATAAPSVRPAPSPTTADRARADALIGEVRQAMSRYRTVADVEAAGYRSIGDAITGFEHFVNARYLLDPEVMVPERVESIVFEVAGDGTKKVVSAMFILPPGQTMTDVPDVAGPLTVWHDHKNLCWEGTRVVGVLVKGTCKPRGVYRPTPPMLHVWVVPNECGPFAGIEGLHGSCHAHA